MDATEGPDPIADTWLAGQVGRGDPTTTLLLLWTARLGHLNERGLEESARTRGRTAAEETVLVALLLVGRPHRLSPTRLREVLAQSSGGMTKTLGRLERAGLVRRPTDPEDGRGLLAQLTPRGEVEAREALDAHVARYDLLLADLGPHERRRLLDAVRTLLDVLEPSLGARPSATGEVIGPS